MLLPSWNPFKCHEEVLYLQPMIPPKRFDIFTPDWGMLRRSRCVQIFLLIIMRRSRCVQISLLKHPPEHSLQSCLCVCCTHFTSICPLGPRSPPPSSSPLRLPFPSPSVDFRGHPAPNGPTADNEAAAVPSLPRGGGGECPVRLGLVDLLHRPQLGARDGKSLYAKYSMFV